MEELSLKYNYVIVGSGAYYLVGYRDVMGLKNVSYHSGYSDGFDGFISRQLLRWNFSRELNKHIKTPFSAYVYPRLYPHHFEDDKPLCYLFFGNAQYVYQTSYLDYLRKHVPGVKLVLYMQDLVSRNRGLHFDKVRDKFDLLVSYDYGDASRYGMSFHPTPMSKVEVTADGMADKNDVYFCGYAKSRWQKVHEVYARCKELGLKCDFNLLDMPKDGEHLAGINYIEKPMDYLENLRHVVGSRCILEVMQDNADGFTPRLWESIMYDRHLLTNNDHVLRSEFYFAYGHHSIDLLRDDTATAVLSADVQYPDALKESLSPRHLLQFIDNLISAK